jgi:hypothetical protein
MGVTRSCPGKKEHCPSQTTGKRLLPNFFDDSERVYIDKAE